MLRHVSPPVLPVAGVDCLQEEAPVAGQSVGLPACRLYHAVRALDPTAGYGEPGVRDNPHRMPPRAVCEPLEAAVPGLAAQPTDVADQRPHLGPAAHLCLVNSN